MSQTLSQGVQHSVYNGWVGGWLEWKCPFNIYVLTCMIYTCNTLTYIGNI